VDTAFLAQRIYEPHGPLVNSEFYTGWLTHWGETFQRVSTDAIVNTLDEMLSRNASVNFFMFYGGTNFGFLAGEILRTNVVVLRLKDTFT
jgi:beta-galactosidase